MFILNVKVFSFAFLQVFFVSLNVYFISKEYFPGIAISSFMINFMWMLNVNNNSKKMNIFYPIGAMFGCLSGVLLGKLLY
jgi:hypothetical protein